MDGTPWSCNGKEKDKGANKSSLGCHKLEKQGAEQSLQHVTC